MHRRSQAFLYCFAAVVLGLVWRLAPLHLPFFLFKYGGSALWAIAVYWLIAALLPAAPPARVAVFAGLVALIVELSRLWHTPAFDAFRATLAGKLLLGRYFSLKNVVAYWLAIAVVAVVHKGWRQRPHRSLRRESVNNLRRS